MRIGLISDTHGLLRPQAVAFLVGCDRIVHAGDICDAAVLDALRAIAPTVAVRGNNDRGTWAEVLQATEAIDVGSVGIVVVHDIADLGAAAEGASVIVSGHSHRPSVDRRGGVLFVNPESAGPRRFKLPISAGELSIEDGQVTVKLVDLGTLPA